MANINTINKIRDKLKQNKKITNDIITNNKIYFQAYLKHNITTERDNIENNIQNSFINKTKNYIDSYKQLNDVITNKREINDINTSKNIENTISNVKNNVIFDKLEKQNNIFTTDTFSSFKNNNIIENIKTSKNNSVFNNIEDSKKISTIESINKTAKTGFNEKIDKLRNNNVVNNVKNLFEKEYLNTNIKRDNSYLTDSYDNVLNNKIIQEKVYKDIYNTDKIQNSKSNIIDNVIRDVKTRNENLEGNNKVIPIRNITENIARPQSTVNNLYSNAKKEGNKKSPLNVDTSSRDLKDNIKFNAKEFISNNRTNNNSSSQNIEVKMINNNSINSNLDINQITNYLKDSLKSNLSRSISSF